MPRSYQWIVPAVVALTMLGITFAVPVESAAGTSDVTPVYRTWLTFPPHDGLPDASIRVIRVVDGDVWVGTDAGLARHDERGWSSWTAADGLPEAPISAIEIDPRTGDLWLGTWGGGLVRFTGGRFDRFTQFNSGLAGDLIFDVALHGGRVWAAGNGGVSVFDPLAGTWGLQLEARADAAPTAVTALLGTDKNLYAGAWGGPLLQLDARHDALRPVGVVNAPGSGETDVAKASGGRLLWWTGRGRLYRHGSGGRWPGRQFERPDIATGFVNFLASRSDSEAWLGTSNGLQVLVDAETETWVLYGIGADRSSGTLALVRAGQVIGRREVASALPDPRVRCLAFDGENVWVGTPRGLAFGMDLTPWNSSRAPGDKLAREPVPVSGDTLAMLLDRPDAGRWEGEARIGVLGPFTRPISLPGASSPWPTPPVDRVAVAQAVERNRPRRTRATRTFVLVDNVGTFARYGWVTAQDSFPMLRDQYDVHGLVGFIDRDARIDTAVALRTEVPVVNIAPTEPTLDESLNPWIFRCGTNDPRVQPRLLDFVFDSLGRTRPALLRTPGKEAEAHFERWTRHAAARGHAIVAELAPDPDGKWLKAQVEALKQTQADVLLTWTDAAQTATLVRRLREAGWTLPVVGSDRIINEEFSSLAGQSPGAVFALARCPHFDLAGEAAVQDPTALQRRPGIARKPVSPQAVRSFDAAVHLTAAIEIAGTDREMVRRVLAAMSRLRVARLQNGAWVVEELGAVDPP